MRHILVTGIETPKPEKRAERPAVPTQDLAGWEIVESIGGKHWLGRVVSEDDTHVDLRAGFELGARTVGLVQVPERGPQGVVGMKIQWAPHPGGEIAYVLDCALSYPTVRVKWASRVKLSEFSATERANICKAIDRVMDAGRQVERGIDTRETGVRVMF